MKRSIPLAAALALAAPAAAQVASSPGFEALAIELDGGAGLAVSPGHAAALTLDGLAGALASPLRGAELGLLPGAEPLSGDAPVVLAVVPHHGDAAGGTPVTVHGLGLDGPGLDAQIANAPLAGLAPLSGTELQATTPPGPHGPADVTLQTVFGKTIAPGAFAFTPAVLSPPAVAVGGQLALTNLGTPGTAFVASYSTVTTNLPLPGIGVLLIGPAPILEVVPLTTLGATGSHEVSLPIPANPALAGVPLHFQSLSLTLEAVPELTLTNRSTTLLVDP